MKITLGQIKFIIVDDIVYFKLESEIIDLADKISFVPTLEAVDEENKCNRVTCAES